MSLRTRRKIFLAFVAVFFVVAPLIILYSMGYRYEWSKRRIEPTGLLLIEGTPGDATVRIDGVIRTRALPARIDGLRGNEYDVRVEREAFRPFTRRVTIVGGRTTSLFGIHLFPIAAPTLLLEGAISHWSVSMDQRWVAFVRPHDAFQELWFLELRTGTRTLALRLPATDRHRMSLSWSPRHATLLATWGDAAAQQIITLVPDTPTRPLTVTSLLPSPATDITWELGSDAALIATVNGRLLRITLRDARALPLPVPVPPKPFGVARHTLYSVHGHRLVAQSLDGEPARSIATLPNAIASFSDLRGVTLTAVTATRTPQTVQIDTAHGTIDIFPGVGRVHGPSRSDPTLRWSPNEVWFAGRDRTRNELLVRRATTIVDVRWIPDGTHALVATATDIAAIAIDPTIQTTATDLATFDHLTGIAPAVDGSLLYVSGRRDGRDGIWTFPLR